jgi:hypothetical protein
MNETGKTGGIRLGLAATIAASLFLLVPLATAAELTRDEYVERAEPICKRNVEANKRIFKGAKEEVKRGELKKASRHFFRAATALKKTIAQLKAVPRPSADAAKLTKWFGYLETEVDYFNRIGKALAAGQKAKAQNLSVRLNRNSSRANNTVLLFNFDYCKIDPTRFT